MFYITISNGLLQGNHYKRMGAAVWVYMWCIDKVTMIDENGWGWVLGGKEIQLKDVKLGHDVTISRNLNKLEEEGYLALTHTQTGIIITVAKAKKRFNKNAGRFSDNAGRFNKSVKPFYIDNNKDNNKDNAEATAPLPFDLKAELQKLKDSAQRHIQLIGEYLEEKKVRIETKDQLEVAKKRHMRAASQLATFSDYQIGKATQQVQQEYPAYTLETLIKVLTRDKV